MSRIGRKPVEIPAGVEIKQDGNVVTVKGPKGELTRTMSSDITMSVDGNVVSFDRPNDNNKMRALHGTTRANFNNMVEGVVNGFEKKLELIGVGYRAQLKGKTLNLKLRLFKPS
jgi:large subunit ribosomal protein L6